MTKIEELRNITGLTLGHALITYITSVAEKPDEVFKYEPRLVTFPTGERMITFADETNQQVAVLRLSERHCTELSIADMGMLDKIFREGVFSAGLRQISDADLREAFPSVENVNRLQEILQLYLFGELSAQREDAIFIDLKPKGAEI